MPLTCQFVQEQFGIGMKEMLTTFNCGLQYVICTPPSDVNRARDAAAAVDFKLFDIGVVEDGPRRVVSDPHGLEFQPPSD